MITLVSSSKQHLHKHMQHGVSIHFLFKLFSWFLIFYPKILQFDWFFSVLEQNHLENVKFTLKKNLFARIAYLSCLADLTPLLFTVQWRSYRCQKNLLEMQKNVVFLTYTCLINSAVLNI